MTRKYSTYTDEELVKMFGKGNRIAEQAFTELYHRYSSIVHAYCLRVLGNEEQAEDIFQETFIKFYKKTNPDAPVINIPGFLITIARNLCLNHKRDHKPLSSLEGIDIPISSAAASIEQKELLELINMSLDLLDFDFRECFVLREYDGLSYKEIADICNTSVNNAKSRVFRAKKKIKEILAPYLEDLCK